MKQIPLSLIISRVSKFNVPLSLLDQEMQAIASACNRNLQNQKHIKTKKTKVKIKKKKKLSSFFFTIITRMNENESDRISGKKIQRSWESKGNKSLIQKLCTVFQISHIRKTLLPTYNHNTSTH